MWFIYALLSAFTAALVAVCGKLGLEHLDTTTATTVRAIVMACLLIITSIWFKKFGTIASTFEFKDWALIIASGIAGALSWLCYFFGLKYGPASKVAAIDRLSIVFVVILSGLVLGETIKLQTILGLIFMVIGSWLIVS